jgi:hypothetical protein
VTPTSTPTTIPGNQNFSLHFNTNDEVRGAIYPNSNRTQTIEFWVKPAQENANGIIFHTRDQDDRDGWIVELRDGKAELWVDDGVTDRSLQNTAVSLRAGQWYHIAATYNASTNLATVYVNGTPSNTANLGDMSPGFQLRMGTFGSGGFTVYNSFVGELEEMRISNIIRYSGAFTPPSSDFTSDSNTVVLYHLNEGSGQTVVDLSGNGRNLTLGASTDIESADPTWGVSSLR